jgi:hypothetical protein
MLLLLLLNSASIILVRWYICHLVSQRKLISEI